VIQMVCLHPCNYLYMAATDSICGCNRLHVAAADSTCVTDTRCGCNRLYTWLQQNLYMAATDSIRGCNRLHVWLQQTLCVTANIYTQIRKPHTLTNTHTHTLQVLRETQRSKNVHPPKHTNLSHKHTHTYTHTHTRTHTQVLGETWRSKNVPDHENNPLLLLPPYL